MKNRLVLIAGAAVLLCLVPAPAHATTQAFVVNANIALNGAPPSVVDLLKVDLAGIMHLTRGVLIPGAYDYNLRAFDAQNVDCNDNSVIDNNTNEMYGFEYNRKEFMVRFGGVPVARLDPLSGNLFIKGVLYQNQTSLALHSGKEFAIRNGSGTVLASFRENGDLYLRGALCEEVAYAPNFPTRMATFGDSVVIGVEALWLPIGGDPSEDPPPSIWNSEPADWLPYLFGVPLNGTPQHSFSSGNAPFDWVYSHAEYVDNYVNPSGFNDDDPDLNKNFGESGATLRTINGTNDFLDQVATAVADPDGPFDYAVVYFGGNDICAHTPGGINCNYFTDTDPTELGIRESLRQGIANLRGDNPEVVIVVLEIFDFVDLWDKVMSLPVHAHAEFCRDLWSLNYYSGYQYCNSFLSYNSSTGDADRAATRQNIQQMNQVIENVCIKEKVYFMRGIFDVFEETTFDIDKMGIDCIHPALPMHARIQEITWYQSIFKD